jgi:hypothetical protein
MMSVGRILNALWLNGRSFAYLLLLMVVMSCA